MIPDPPGATSHPERLAHYRIIKPIGAGGMAEVYLAHDSRLEREVTLKLLPQSVVADEARRPRTRFPNVSSRLSGLATLRTT